MGKFQIIKDGAGRFRFRLKATNGEIILASEGYLSKTGCENGIASVKLNAPKKERYERKRSFNDQSYFMLKAANGEVIGRSEMYTTNSGMERGIQSVMTIAPNSRIDDHT